MPSSKGGNTQESAWLIIKNSLCKTRCNSHNKHCPFDLSRTPPRVMTETGCFQALRFRASVSFPPLTRHSLLVERTQETKAIPKVASETHHAVGSVCGNKQLVNLKTTFLFGLLIQAWAFIALLESPTFSISHQKVGLCKSPLGH